MPARKLSKTAQIYLDIVLCLGQSVHFIQSWKIFSTKSAEDISLTAYIILLVLLIHWLVYGLYIQSKTLVVAESFGILGVLIVICGVILGSLKDVVQFL